MIKIGAGNLNEVFEELEREKGISKEVVISSLCDAMVAAYKKHLRIKEIENVEAFLDEQSGEIGIFKGKVVVESVEDPDNEISLAEAKEIDDSVELGDEVIIWDNENITLEELADKCNTINYEILCTISSRVPRKFV